LLPLTALIFPLGRRKSHLLSAEVSGWWRRFNGLIYMGFKVTGNITGNTKSPFQVGDNDSLNEAIMLLLAFSHQGLPRGISTETDN
jgi:hypothetical protein